MQVNFVPHKVDAACRTEINEVKVTQTKEHSSPGQDSYTSDVDHDCDVSQDYVPSETDESSEDDTRNLSLIVTQQYIRCSPM